MHFLIRRVYLPAIVAGFVTFICSFNVVHQILHFFSLKGSDTYWDDALLGMLVCVTVVVLIYRRELRSNHLTKSVEELTDVVERSDDAISSVLPDGVITTWNRGAERMYGYTKEEAIGRSIRDLIVPATLHEDWDKTMQRVGRGEVVDGLETVRLTKTGERRYVSLKLSPVHDQEGRLMGYSGVSIDLTESKRANLLEQQFLQAQKLEGMGRLAGGVAHDFNNILMIIKTYSQNLKEDLPPDHPLQADVAEIIKASNRAVGLTQQMLAFSRKQVLSPQVININGIVEDTAKMLRRLIGEDIKLVFQRDPSLWKTLLDAGQIVQILINLCVNARDAMPGGGNLVVATSNVEIGPEFAALHKPMQPGNYVLLSVSDDGSGMTAEIRERIFEPFFTTKEVGKGTGLGLATVYGIVKQSGGSLWVYSEPGMGTTFKLYFPATDKLAEANAPHTQVPVSGNGELILVVEDEAPLRGAICKSLSKAGFRPVSAINGRDALAEIRKLQESPRVLLTDVVMPEMGGRELEEALSKVYSEIKTIYMSGYTDDMMLTQNVLKPGVNFLQKPFLMSTLVEKIDLALRTGGPEDRRAPVEVATTQQNSASL